MAYRQRYKEANKVLELKANVRLCSTSIKSTLLVGIQRNIPWDNTRVAFVSNTTRIAGTIIQGCLIPYQRV